MTNRMRNLVALVVVAALVLGVFWPVTRFDFVAFDDPEYVTGNPGVLGGLGGGSLRWAFTTFHAANWHPMTWLSHQSDVELLGMVPGSHHAVNLAFHLGAVLLLFIFLRTLTGSFLPSLLVAIVAGIHPLHVESVAWVSQRKDVLSNFFLMLTLLAWTKHLRGVYHPLLPLEGGGGVGVWPKDVGFVIHPPPTPPLEGGEQETRGHDPTGIPGHDLNSGTSELRIVSLGIPSSAQTKDSSKSPNYLLALVFFALALMSKPTVIVLPLLLCLLDWWPLGRLGAGGARRTSPGRLLLEKVPFFLLALAAAVPAYLAQVAGGATGGMLSIAPVARLATALYVTALPLGKTLLPTGLAAFYPHPGVFPASTLLLAAAALLFPSVLAWMTRRSHPWIGAGWGWYLVFLAPVSGLVQFGSHAGADRYSYLAMTGILLAASFELSRVPRRRPWPAVTATAVLVAIVILAGGARRQVGYWRDSEALFTRALAVTSDNWLAHNTLGAVLLDRGETGPAIGHFRAAILADPAYARAWYNLGLAQERSGSDLEAHQAYLRAIDLDPGYRKAHAALASLLARTGHPERAVEHRRRALEGATKPPDHPGESASGGKP